MPFKEVMNQNDPKKIELVPSQGEVGNAEDLGKNVSWEIAHSTQGVDERIDADTNNETNDTRSVEEIQNDIQSFREQIKIGETKDANGHYNEKLILENEAKLRKAEQLLANKQEEANQKNELAALREEIKGYRENIKLGETKDANGRYNEQLVLENEVKLKEAEKRITNLSAAEANRLKTPLEKNIQSAGSLGELYKIVKEAGSIQGSSELYSSDQIWERVRAFVNNEADETVITRTGGLREKVKALKLQRELNKQAQSQDTKTTEQPKKKKGLLSRIFGFGKKE